MNKNRINIKIIFSTLILILLFSFSHSVSAEDINDYDYLKLKLSNNFSFYLNFKENYRVEEFTLQSYILPPSIKENQALNEFKTNHNNYEKKSEINFDYLEFKFNKKDLKSENIINNEFIIESVKNFPKISKKSKYPIINTSEDLNKYLEFKNLIDSNDEILQQASSLANGEDDLYVIASKIAKWIREDVTYDLSTVANNPNQKSTETFKLKTGVCKEISNLFISMMRSLGIPTRIVTGYAYTNSDEIVKYVGSHWGGHAWTEVLIGDKWVPFDLTYNQYGFVDASHIAFLQVPHILKTTASLSMNGYGISFSKNLEVKNDFEILDKKKAIKNDNDFIININGPDKLGFNSYGYINATIKNPSPYYKNLFITFPYSENIKLIEKPNNQIEIFKPYEIKNIYLKYKIEDNFEKNYEHNLIFYLYFGNEMKEFKLIISNGNEILSLEELPKDIISQKEKSNNELNLNCDLFPNYPKNQVICNVQNTNNFEIEKLYLCTTEICIKEDLILNENKKIILDTDKTNETITYNFDKTKEKSIKLEIKQPKLILNESLNYQNLKLNYQIENYFTGLTVEFYDNNNNLIKSFSEQNNQLNQTLNFGKHNLTIKLKIKNKILSESQLNYEIIQRSKIDELIIKINNFLIDFKSFIKKFTPTKKEIKEYILSL